jgi:hypothetical protein
MSLVNCPGRDLNPLCEILVDTAEARAAKYCSDRCMELVHRSLKPPPPAKPTGPATSTVDAALLDLLDESGKTDWYHKKIRSY